MATAPRMTSSSAGKTKTRRADRRRSPAARNESSCGPYYHPLGRGRRRTGQGKRCPGPRNPSRTDEQRGAHLLKGTHYLLPSMRRCTSESTVGSSSDSAVATSIFLTDELRDDGRLDADSAARASASADERTDGARAAHRLSLNGGSQNARKTRKQKTSVFFYVFID